MKKEGIESKAQETKIQAMSAVAFRHAIALGQRDFINITVTGDLRKVDFSMCSMSNVDLLDAQIDNTTQFPPYDKVTNIKINKSQFDILIAQNRKNFTGFDLVMPTDGLLTLPPGLVGLRIGTQQFASLIKLGRLDFSGFDLRGIDLSGPETKKLTFINADLRGCQLNPNNLPPPDKLRGAKIDSDQFNFLVSQNHKDFKGFDLQFVDLLNAPLGLQGVKISNDQFYNLVARGRKNFNGFDLKDVNLQKAPNDLIGLEINTGTFTSLIYGGRNDFTGFHYKDSKRVTIPVAALASTLISANKCLTHVKITDLGILKDISDCTFVRVDIRGVPLTKATLPPPQKLDGLKIDDKQFWLLRQLGRRDFSGFDLRHVGFKAFDCSNCTFIRTDLRGNELDNRGLPPPDRLNGARIDTEQFLSLVKQGRKNFSGFDLRFVDLSKAPSNLYGLRITMEEFKKLLIQGRRNFSGFDFRDFNLSEWDLSQLTLHNTDLRGVPFDKGTKLPAGIQGARIDRVGIVSLKNIGHKDFSYFNFNGATLSGLDLSDFVMINADLRGTTFDGTTKLPSLENLQGARLDRSAIASLLKIGHKDFSKFNLIGVDLVGLPMAGCILPPADNLRKARIDDKQFKILVDQGNKDFRMFDLQNLDVSTYNLNGFQFDDANLQGGKLPKDLTGVSLCGTDLRGHPLKTYILTNADIRGLQVNSTDTNDTDLTGLKEQTLSNYKSAFANTNDLKQLYQQVESFADSAHKQSLLITVSRGIELLRRSRVKGEFYEKIIQAAQARAIEICGAKNNLSPDDIKNLESLAQFNVLDTHRGEYKLAVAGLQVKAQALKDTKQM